MKKYFQGMVPLYCGWITGISIACILGFSHLISIINVASFIAISIIGFFLVQPRKVK